MNNPATLRWFWLALLILSSGWLLYNFVKFAQDPTMYDARSNAQGSAQSNTQANAQAATDNNDSSDAFVPSVPTGVPSSVPNNTASGNAASSADGVPVASFPAGDDITIDTPIYRARISREGGNLVRLELKQYPISIEDTRPSVLLDKYGADPFYLQAGLLSNDAAPNHKARFESAQSAYTLTENAAEPLRVPLVWQDGARRVVKTYVFYADRHEVILDMNADNGSAQPWQLAPYVQVSRARPESSRGLGGAYTYTGPAWWSEDDGFEKVDFDEVESDAPSITTVGGWLAMVQHYFIAAVIPQSTDAQNMYTRKVGAQFLVGTIEAQKSLAAGASADMRYTLFMGPKITEDLTALHPELDYAIDYGIFHALSSPLFWLLKKIFGVVGNWGVAIVIITLLIKFGFYPLTVKSYRSMGKMRKLAPKLQELKERYQDDKMALQKKMMEMYREEKVNPLGGCLPVLVQIPVFIALYWALVESVELRQAPLALWIQDLSVPDPYFVLPVLMGITMFLQQRLNPAPLDATQARILQFLPIVFTVFVLFFPAGLVFYWIISNTITIAQQWYINRAL